MKIVYILLATFLLSGCLEYSFSGSGDKLLSGQGVAASLIGSVIAESDPPDYGQDPQNPYYINTSVTGIIRHETQELRLFPAEPIPGTEHLDYLVMSGDISKVGRYGSESTVGNIPGTITDDVPGANARYFQVGAYLLPVSDRVGQIAIVNNYIFLRTPLKRQVRIYYDYTQPPQPIVYDQWSYFTDEIDQWPTAERDREAEAYLLAVMHLSNGGRKYLLNGISYADEQGIISMGWFRSVGQVDMDLSRCIEIVLNSVELEAAINKYHRSNPGKKIGMFGEQVGYKSVTPNKDLCGANFWGGVDSGMDVFKVHKYLSY